MELRRTRERAARAAVAAAHAGPERVAAAAAVAAWCRYLREYKAGLPLGHAPWSRTYGPTEDGLDVGPPATEAELKALQAALGTPITAELRAILRVTNGAAIDVAGYDLYAAKGMISVMESQRLLLETEWKDDARLNTASDGQGVGPGVKYAWWRTLWLPIGGDGVGNDLVADYDPDLEDGGVVGQILDHDHETGDCPRLARTLTELLNKQSDAIVSGDMRWDPSFGRFTDWHKHVPASAM